MGFAGLAVGAAMVLELHLVDHLFMSIFVGWAATNL